MAAVTGAGELRDRVLLLSPVRTPDSFADRPVFYSPFRGWIAARFKSLSSRELITAQQVQGQHTATVRVRAAAMEGVKHDWRLLYREGIFELTGDPIEVRENGRLEFYDLPVLETTYATE